MNGVGRQLQRRGARIVLAAAVVVLTVPAAAQAVPLLPDLVADPPGLAPPGKLLDETKLPGRRLVRFDGWVHNKGPGCVHIVGTNPQGGVMTTVVQRLYEPGDCQSHSNPTEVPIAGARIRFETNDTHMHWHLIDAARYSLWDDAMTREVAPAKKVGFCLLDWENTDKLVPWAAFLQASIRRCEHDDPGAASVQMGISPGWRDLYQYYLDLQWVDVSNVAPGVYRIAESVDPNNLIREADETNPLAFSAPVTIPGYVARNLRRRVKGRGRSRIKLAARSVGSPSGGLRFSISARPKHGRLSKRAGTAFKSATIRYRPRRGYHGRDSFKFVARDGAFPLKPVAATVRLRVQRARRR
jgi:lysyl oxidase